MHACMSKKKLATFKAERNDISNDFQVLKHFIHTSGRQTNTHHIPKIFVYIYYKITDKYLVHRTNGTPEDECGENEMPKNEKFMKFKYALHF